MYPKRTILGFTMVVTQSFLYNAIFFTYALVLENFYDIPTQNTGYYFFPFAIGNLLGPLLLGHLFDTVGRRTMIFGTYGLAGVVLAVSAALFQADALTATTQVVFWCVSFFFASAGASLMLVGGIVALIFGVNAEGQSLEDVADPLSKVGSASDTRSEMSGAEQQ